MIRAKYIRIAKLLSICIFINDTQEKLQNKITISITNDENNLLYNYW